MVNMDVFGRFSTDADGKKYDNNWGTCTLEKCSDIVAADTGASVAVGWQNETSALGYGHDADGL